mmetsp:Transcript_32012/g.83372  ORF Transcript_32012/g.83372 Transcript_32012/m.83372 type:complete len:86 (+) Transcript_32012:719-976(+)
MQPLQKKQEAAAQQQLLIPHLHWQKERKNHKGSRPSPPPPSKCSGKPKRAGMDEGGAAGHILSTLPTLFMAPCFGDRWNTCWRKC